MMIYFLQGKANRIANFTTPVPMRVSVRKKRDVRIEVDGERPILKIDLHLDVATLEEHADLMLIEKSLKGEMEDLISKCQKLKVEPFGFAEIASKKFINNREYENYDWLSSFSKASVEITLHINNEK